MKQFTVRIQSKSKPSPMLSPAGSSETDASLSAQSKAKQALVQLLVAAHKGPRRRSFDLK